MDQPKTATLLDFAREIITRESDTLRDLADSLDSEFEKAVEMVLNCNGRVVISGVGKSGIIGRKISATLLSTGTPAMFLHPTEGVHGDLGAILPVDIVILISNSGESSEILSLLPALRALGVKVIAMTGKPESTLSRESILTLKCCITREADEHNLIPTSSTAAQLAMGDALALTIMKQRGLGSDDLAARHPGGSIGKRLLLNVSDLMTASPDDPKVSAESVFRDALFELTGKHLGAVSVVDNDGMLKGIITDGDVKRLLEKAEKEKKSIEHMMETGVTEIMIRDPKRLTEKTKAVEALQYMESNQISQIPVVDSSGKVCGMLRLLDLVKSGM
jgi:arabinose-5-phosphate isomerase